MKKIIPSKFQKDIFDIYRTTNKNIVISAVPGSGKTTTIIELLKMKKTGRSAIFAAFNKSIVEELEKKLPQDIHVTTLHSLGCKAIYKKHRGQVEVQQYKLFRIAKKIEKTLTVEQKKKDFYIFNLIKIVDLYRLRLESSEDAIESIIAHYDIEIIGNEVEDSKKLLSAYYTYNSKWQSEGKKFMIDFVDMVYLPAVKDYELYQYDDVFVDESQDLNAAQQKLIEKVIKPKTGRFVAVGDPRQSIYGFMSADVDSYHAFAKKENTVELPLSFSYRCGTKIADAANEVWDVIQSPEDMFEGEIIEKAKLDDVKQGDFILCRNNKPLVEAYLELLKKEIPCYIKGSEIGKSIISLIKGYETLPKDIMIQSLEGQLTHLYEELHKRGIRKPTNHPRYVGLSEKISIIKLIGKNYNNTSSICKVIEQMFQDSSKGIMLSSIHKSKGLETDNVYILERSLIPSKYATQPHQLVQENNLLYVAITRAKRKLGFI